MKTFQPRMGAATILLAQIGYNAPPDQVFEKIRSALESAGWDTVNLDPTLYHMIVDYHASTIYVKSEPTPLDSAFPVWQRWFRAHTKYEDVHVWWDTLRSESRIFMIGDTEQVEAALRDFDQSITRPTR